ncbi:hypothetical protein M427DRAFT_150822 [Gonapodya prolifera JEL478]|uniref:Uncharacterized protein n=1 Tax=Gonapodya prolifera (strain JEL478) TaxID=1344416 RepID=A0A139B0T1_GONPJ|nr:hypothetical protein M427DRAFT_150822 [Gonapodya prolifera JEL478]|eukprot:KXS22584.1 hypothetical protein M427DRAFT_150822 [Gonapodya prolifera JEL478]
MNPRPTGPSSHPPFYRGPSSCTDMASGSQIRLQHQLSVGPPALEARPDSEINLDAPDSLPPLLLARENSDGTETVYPFAYLDSRLNHVHVDLSFDPLSRPTAFDTEDDEEEELFAEHMSSDEDEFGAAELTYLYPPDAESGLYSMDDGGSEYFDMQFRVMYGENPFASYAASDPYFLRQGEEYLGTFDEEPPGLISEDDELGLGGGSIAVRYGVDDIPVGELGLFHTRSGLEVRGNAATVHGSGFHSLLASLEAEAERMARREVELVAEIREEERRLEELMRQVVEGLEGRVRDTDETGR